MEPRSRGGKPDEWEMDKKKANGPNKVRQRHQCRRKRPECARVGWGGMGLDIELPSRKAPLITHDLLTDKKNCAHTGTSKENTNTTYHLGGEGKSMTAKWFAAGVGVTICPR